MNIQKLKERKDVDGLIRALADKDDNMRGDAAAALGAMGDARAVEPLISVLNDKYFRVRQVAARVLGELGDPRDVEPLCAILKDEDRGVRRAAALALGKTGDSRARAPLLALLNDTDSRIREAANEALELIRVRMEKQTLEARLGGPTEDLILVRAKGEIARSWMSRLVRVFISSTFRDMQEERDILVKKVFPELRQRCRERGVEFVEVDLRWGVTEEEAERGEVLPICLAEIENCRPYFIGLLGERYGWVASCIDNRLVEDHPWLAEYSDKSLTELEILHGVLRTPEMARRAFFYFRDPAYVRTIPRERRADFEAESEAARTKLAELKARIRASGFPVVDGYSNPESLGQLVLGDLGKVIDQEFPAGSEQDRMKREKNDHEAYAVSQTESFVGRNEYLGILDEHVKGTDPLLVVVGDAGVGKSALLANWAARYRKAHPYGFLLLHFVGCTPASADWMALVRRIKDELSLHFNIKKKDEPGPLWSWSLFSFFEEVATWGRIVIVLDGLDQLEDVDDALDLGWLPQKYPPSILVILSTQPGRSLEAAKRRGWRTLTILPLGHEERKELTNRYLWRHRKRLSDERVDRIAASSQTGNPLYLRMLLEELRMFGVHEKLDHRITYYLEAADIAELFQKILTRLESDYEGGRPRLVCDAMSLLWAARRGLTEHELMKLLGSSDIPIARTVWSPLYLAMQEFLVNRSGMFMFAHATLRDVVRDRYLSTFEQQRMVHIKLADYFSGEEFRVPEDSEFLRQMPFVRKVEETPWQLAQAREWKRLAELLTDGAFSAAAAVVDPFETGRYWSQIEKIEPSAIFEAIRSKLISAEEDDIVSIVVSLFAGTSLTMGQSVLKFLCDQSPHATRLMEKIRDLLRSEGIIYAVRHPKRAVRLWRGAELISRELGDKKALTGITDDLSKIYDVMNIVARRQGDLTEAGSAIRELESICRETGNMEDLAWHLLTHADYMLRQKRHDEALTMATESLTLYRQLQPSDPENPERAEKNRLGMELAKQLVAELTILVQMKSECPEATKEIESGSPARSDEKSGRDQ